ncbi:MAG TPA: homoserine kinase [Bacillota bacterium]|nr:homoserine kinase [Bacillota bacterium]HPZ89997.1 homoserine kinase [Bacillota bacterium]HQE01404.1 homoserine kinase [Bacillota bacterium]
MVRLAVPATAANLGPGYDCLGLALALYNYLELEPARRWQLVIRGEGAEGLPRDESNLVWQSMEHLWRQTGTPVPCVKLTLVNGIPLGRGLGSSAAAIVGGLSLANHWLDKPLDKEELLQLAAELEGHPDNVAPALLGGLCLSVTEAGRTIALNWDLPPHLRLAVCIPDFSLSTQAARAVLPRTVAHADAVFNLSRTALLLAALAQKRLDLLGTAARDRLHQEYRKDLTPGFDAVVTAAVEAGALACTLSGAGPSLLAFVVSAADGEKAGRAMAAAFGRWGVQARWVVLRPDTRGVRAIK